jgi:hypothetical protein
MSKNLDSTTPIDSSLCPRKLSQGAISECHNLGKHTLKDIRDWPEDEIALSSMLIVYRNDILQLKKLISGKFPDELQKMWPKIGIGEPEGNPPDPAE